MERLEDGNLSKDVISHPLEGKKGCAGKSKKNKAKAGKKTEINGKK